MSGGEEALNPTARRVEDGADGRGNEHVGDENREVGDTEPASLVDRQGVGRGCGLEADGEEDDLALGVVDGHLHGVEW